MENCPRCGSPLKGRFCTNCGYDTASPRINDPAPVPNSQERREESQRKAPTILWVLVAVAGCLLLVFLALLVAKGLREGPPKPLGMARATVRLERTAETEDALALPAAVPSQTVPPVDTPPITDVPVATDAPAIAITPEPTAFRTPAPAPVFDDPDALLPTAQMLNVAAKGKVKMNGVKLYRGSSSDAPLLASGLQRGAEVTVYAKDGDFYFLQVNETGQCGFISKGLVNLVTELEEIPPGSDQPDGTVRGTISSISLVLREKPLLNSQVLGKYFEGKMVYIYYQQSGYYYVQVAGSVLKGYMALSHIDPEGPVPTQTP